MKRLSTIPLLALVFTGSGLAMLPAAWWFISPPASREDLYQISGIVEDATDTRNYTRDPSGTASFALTIHSDGKAPLRLHVVKHPVDPNALRALVGRTVSATFHRGLIYDLKSDGTDLVTYRNTVRMIEAEETAAYGAAITCLVIGIGLALFAYVRKRKPEVS